MSCPRRIPSRPCHVLATSGTIAQRLPARRDRDAQLFRRSEAARTAPHEVRPRRARRRGRDAGRAMASRKHAPRRRRRRIGLCGLEAAAASSRTRMQPATSANISGAGSLAGRGTVRAPPLLTTGRLTAAEPSPLAASGRGGWGGTAEAVVAALKHEAHRVDLGGGREGARRGRGGRRVRERGRKGGSEGARERVWEGEREGEREGAERGKEGGRAKRRGGKTVRGSVQPCIRREQGTFLPI